MCLAAGIFPWRMWDSQQWDKGRGTAECWRMLGYFLGECETHSNETGAGGLQSAEECCKSCTYPTASCNMFSNSLRSAEKEWGALRKGVIHAYLSNSMESLKSGGGGGWGESRSVDEEWRALSSMMHTYPRAGSYSWRASGVLERSGEHWQWMRWMMRRVMHTYPTA